MTTTTEPKLAAPGAGLPAIELFFARLLFALRCRMGNREAFTAKFQQERAGIHALVESCDVARRGERVLIRRLRGLEDSSRKWSVWMTLDHLRITNEAFARVITDLTQGRITEGKASTAAVKPSPTVTVAVEAEYEKSCDAVLAAVAAAPDLKTRLRFGHPWFGPMDAAAWHALAGMHLGIHRAQIGRIIGGMPAAMR